VRALTPSRTVTRMTSAELLTDGFERVQEAVHDAVGGLDAADLAYRVDPDANSIAWLIWHLTRVQDDHVAHVADRPQVYDAQGFADRFGSAFDARAIGYGHSSDEVGQVRVDSPRLLLDYFDAVHAQTIDYVGGLSDADLPRIVDTRWDPPVTLAVRLVSVLDDCLEHAGQAAFVKGVVVRRRSA
jgi:hypothetical protein